MLFSWLAASVLLERWTDACNAPSSSGGTSGATRTKDENMNKRQPKPEKETNPTGNVEGEGSYSAARRHRKSAEEHIQQNDTEKLGRKAKQALEGDEGSKLREAEEQGKRPARR